MASGWLQAISVVSSPDRDGTPAFLVHGTAACPAGVVCRRVGHNGLRRGKVLPDGAFLIQYITDLPALLTQCNPSHKHGRDARPN